MRVLFTGADGYIGAILGPKLLASGYDAIGVDAGFYRRGWLFDDRLTRPMVITKDVRELSVVDLRGVDAVVHLAELSNDPLGENDPEITMSINYRGSVRLARTCKAAGVGRFIFASSCSLYGSHGGEEKEEKTETSATDPQTAYARCKVLVEDEVHTLAGSRFAPVFLRNATAFGASPRQRFDVVLNNLAGFAFTTGEIRVMSDGTPWRPLVHVEDICEAAETALDEFRNSTAAIGSSRSALRDLESTAQTYRQISESFQKQFLETSQEQYFSPLDARILSEAWTPAEKSHPRRSLVLAIAAGFGLAIGFLIALLRGASRKRSAMAEIG
jgi:nucleoside-diphosphate-sugar epimerase